MLSLHSFFVKLPTEEAIARRAREVQQADNFQFCRDIVLGVVNGVTPSSSAPPKRPPGRPVGSFSIEVLARSMVYQVVDSVVEVAESTAQSTAQSTTGKIKKSISQVGYGGTRDGFGNGRAETE